MYCIVLYNTVYYVYVSRYTKRQGVRNISFILSRFVLLLFYHIRCSRFVFLLFFEWLVLVCAFFEWLALACALLPSYTYLLFSSVEPVYIAGDISRVCENIRRFYMYEI